MNSSECRVEGNQNKRFVVGFSSMLYLILVEYLLLLLFTYSSFAQSKNLCNPCSSSFIWNQFDLNAIIYGALFCS